MGVDPISMIAAALLAGAAAAASKVASKAVLEAYDGLKQLLRARFAGKPSAEMVLDEFETEPEVWAAPLKKRLQEIDVANDHDLLTAAQRLERTLAEAQPGTGGVGIRDARNVAMSGGRVANIDIGGAASGNAIVAATGDVTGPVSASATTTGLSGTDVRALFEPILSTVRQRPADPDVDNREIQQHVEQVRDEAAKGSNANPNKIKRWLGLLADVAPDVGRAVSAILRRPDAAVSDDVRQLVQHETGAGQTAN
jgi:hypothetical protein